MENGGEVAEETPGEGTALLVLWDEGGCGMHLRNQVVTHLPVAFMYFWGTFGFCQL